MCEDPTLDRATFLQAQGTTKARLGRVVLALCPEDGVQRVPWVQTELVLRAAPDLCELCTAQLWGRLVHPGCQPA